MATTANRNYRYPSQNGEPDAAGDIQRLAEDVDNDIKALDAGLPTKISAGTDSLSITSTQSNVTKTITLRPGSPRRPSWS